VNEQKMTNKITINFTELYGTNIQITLQPPMHTDESVKLTAKYYALSKMRETQHGCYLMV